MGKSDAPERDPLTTLDLVEDFITGGITAGIIGQTGMATNGGTFSVIATEADHPGIARMDSSAVPGTTAAIYGRVGGGTGSVLPASMFDLEWLFRLNTNDANTMVRVGLANSFISATPNDGIWIEKTHSDTEWFGVCRASSTSSRTAALASVDTGWHTIRLRRINGTTIGFSLDGGAEVTLTTNVPTAACQPGLNITNDTAASKTIDTDYWRLKVTGLGR